MYQSSVSSTTNLISYYLAANYPVSLASQFLTNEIATSKNIKDKTNRLKVNEALNYIKSNLPRDNSMGTVFFVGEDI